MPTTPIENVTKSWVHASIYLDNVLPQVQNIISVIAHNKYPYFRWLFLIIECVPEASRESIKLSKSDKNILLFEGRFVCYLIWAVA